jgi:ubiquinone/menaquinone biosynthesis C-methylase UbiE
MQYEACVVPYLLGPWIPDLIRCARLQIGDRVLDVACGTGAVTRAAAAKVGSSGSVVGLDISPEMLGVARQTSKTVVPTIQWRLGDAGSMPFADSSFDVVLCHQGLQFFTDRRRAVEDFRRVLSPHGRVAAVVWSGIENNPYCLAVARAAGRHLGEDVGRQFRTAFALSELSELRSILVHPGFKSVEVQSLTKKLKLPPLRKFIPLHFASTSLATIFASTDRETRAAVIADVASQLQIDEPSSEAVFPFEVNLGLAQ